MPHGGRACRNVSFGLKPAGTGRAEQRVPARAARGGADRRDRPCVERSCRRTAFPDEQWNAALDLIYDRRREGFDPLTHFISLFPDGRKTFEAKKASPVDNLPIEEKLKRHIIDGEKRNLTADLDEAREKYKPLADHQRPPAGRDESGRRPVRQRADAVAVRAAERRDDEGGGRLP